MRRQHSRITPAQSPQTAPSAFQSSLLAGYAEIAAFLRLSVRQAQRYAKADPMMPVCRLGSRMLADRGALVLWLLERRKRARRAP
jgi:hypothetical protein